MLQPMGRVQGAQDIVEHHGFAQNKSYHQRKPEYPPSDICLLQQALERRQITAVKQPIKGQKENQKQKGNIKDPLLFPFHASASHPFRDYYCNSIGNRTQLRTV